MKKNKIDGTQPPISAPRPSQKLSLRPDVLTFPRVPPIHVPRPEEPSNDEFSTKKGGDFFDGVYDFIVLSVLRPWEHYQCVLWISSVRFAATRVSEMVWGSKSKGGYPPI